jgi:hypothetical protein
VDLDRINSFDRSFQQSHDIDSSIVRDICHYQRITSFSHPDRAFDFGHSLEYDKGIDQDLD